MAAGGEDGAGAYGVSPLCREKLVENVAINGTERASANAVVARRRRRPERDIKLAALPGPPAGVPRSALVSRAASPRPPTHFSPPVVSFSLMKKKSRKEPFSLLPRRLVISETERNFSFRAKCLQGFLSVPNEMCSSEPGTARKERRQKENGLRQ